MELLKNIYDIRYNNLCHIIDRDYQGNWTKLGEAIGKKQSYMSELKNKKPTRPFNEELARLIESILGLSTLSLDQEHASTDYNETANDDVYYVPEYDIKMSAGSGCEVIHEDIIRQIPLLKSELRMLGLNEKHLAIFTVDGDSMMNSLVSGEKVLIDTSQKSPSDNRIFAVCLDNTILIKRLFIDPINDKVTISSDNDSYKRFDFLANEDVKIVGLAVLTLGRKLS